MVNDVQFIVKGMMMNPPSRRIISPDFNSNFLTNLNHANAVVNFLRVEMKCWSTEIEAYYYKCRVKTFRL